MTKPRSEREGRENFERTYRSLVDEWRLYDNSGSRPVLIDRGENA